MKARAGMGWRAAAATAAAAGALGLSACNVDDFFNTSRTGTLTVDEKVVLGLRKALEVGIDSSATVASKLNGYLAHAVIKILLPEEAGNALAAAEQVGAYIKPFTEELKLVQEVAKLYPSSDKASLASNLSASNTLLLEIASLDAIGDSVVKYMNRAAEAAAPRSVPIFKGAVAGLTLDDGLSLLNSSDSTAASAYLKVQTFSPLVTSYAPLVDSTLALLPLTEYWGDFRSAYNSILAHYGSLVAFQESWNRNTVVATVPALQIDKLQKVAYKPIATESLGAWTTDKALTGLFWLVGEEEKEIRRDPFAYVRHLASELSTILKEVFGEIMEMEKK